MGLRLAAEGWLFENLVDQKCRDAPVGLRIRMSIPGHPQRLMVLTAEHRQHIEHRDVQFAAPDGKHIVFDRVRDNSDIVLMNLAR